MLNCVYNIRKCKIPKELFTIILLGASIFLYTQATCQPNTKEKKYIDIIKVRTKYVDCVVIGRVVKIEGHPKEHYKSWVWVDVEEYLKEEQDRTRPKRDTILTKSIAGIIDTTTGLTIDVFLSFESPPTVEEEIPYFGGHVPYLEKIGETVLLFLKRPNGKDTEPDTIRTDDFFNIKTYYRVVNDKTYRWNAGYIKTEKGVEFDWDKAYIADLTDFKDWINSAVAEEKFGVEY